MKLLEILVKELKKWPEGAEFAVQHKHSCGFKWVIFGKGQPARNKHGIWCQFGNYSHEFDFLSNELAEDCHTAVITREQYEAALQYNGEGLPPVGTECEWQDKYGEWVKCEILLYRKNIVVMETDVEGGSVTVTKTEFAKFRPLRTEEQIRRSDICDKIYGAMTKAERKENRSDMAEAVYDAIAAGKIPGVKLS